jgi:hypothetical protein
METFESALREQVYVPSVCLCGRLALHLARDTLVVMGGETDTKLTSPAVTQVP